MIMTSFVCCYEYDYVYMNIAIIDVACQLELCHTNTCAFRMIVSLCHYSCNPQARLPDFYRLTTEIRTPKLYMLGTMASSRSAKRIPMKGDIFLSQASKSHDFWYSPHNP